jgi:predicted pyridoxine 5'-phosphate oxidase superfamily flavin-nucleotide-binding protein
MPALPEIVIKEWENRDGPVCLATVDENGMPNAIYATCVNLFDQKYFVVANNFFNKTKANILAGSKASLLFITKGEIGKQKSYQIKGTIEFQSEGEIFEEMKRWNPPKLPGHSAAVLTVEEIYSGADKLF